MEFPVPRTDLPYELCYRRARGGEAIEHCHTDLELGDLTVEVPG